MPLHNLMQSRNASEIYQQNLQLNSGFRKQYTNKLTVS